MANRILVDTGFWYAVFDAEDCYKENAKKLLDSYFDKPSFEILVPFPTMYELLRTKFVKNKIALNSIHKMFKSERIIKVYDDSYREKAIEMTLQEPKRNISLVDNIIRLMLDDKKISAKGLITFNVGDFQDVCKKNSIEILL